MSLDRNKRHTVLQDISAIAKKALEDTQKATESDWSAILSEALEAIIELCQFEQDDAKHAVLHPAVWPKPSNHFGQVVTARHGGGESHVQIIGMRFRTASKWEYQIVEMIDGKPDVYCDGRWYPEFALSEVSNEGA